MLNIKTLAYDITNLTDARYFAAWGVDYLGFELAEGQPTQVGDALLLAIREWVEGPQILGSFQLESVETIQARKADLSLDVVLVPPFTPADQLVALASSGTLMQRVSVLDNSPLPSFLAERASYVQAFVLECPLPWSDLPDYLQEEIIALGREHTLFLSISLQPEELSQLIADCPQMGLALRGGDEEKVGYKSFDELDDIFDLLLE